MNKVPLFFCAFLFCINVHAQKRAEPLYGEWVACGKIDSLYKRKKILLYNDITYQQYANCCNLTGLRIDKHGSAYLFDRYECTEPGRTQEFNAGRLSFEKKQGQLIKLIKLNKLKNQQPVVFKVISIREEKLLKYPFTRRILSIEKADCIK